MSKRMLMACFLCTVLVICLLLYSGCSQPLPDTTLYDNGIEMTLLMGDMIKNPDYLDILGLSLYSSSVEKFYANDYDTPIRTYIIEVPSNERILEMLTIGKTEELNELSSDLREQLRNLSSFEKIISNLILQNSNFDEHIICMALSAQKVIEGTLKKDVAYLYTFETGKPIIVYYRQQANNSILVKSFFMGKNDYETLSETREIFEKLECTVTVYD